MVYEGDMEDADAKVVVLPLWERQKAWPSTHKHILDSGKVCSLKYTEFYIFLSLLDLIYCPRTFTGVLACYVYYMVKNLIWW